MRNVIRNEKGTITIYLSIIFMAMVLFIGLFVDLARIKTAQNQLARVANASARSVLADYNTGLRKEFGLFATKDQKADYNGDFARYMKSNLTFGNGSNKLIQLEYVGSSLHLLKPINDREVLKQQILEDMKYAAPIELTKTVLEKLKPIASLFKYADKQKKARSEVKDAHNKLKEITVVNRDIKKQKEEIRGYKQDIRLKKKDLENLEKQAAPDEQKQPQRDSLTTEITDLQGQIEKREETIQKDLEKSEDIRTEIQKDINNIQSIKDENTFHPDDKETEDLQKSINESFDNSIATLRNEAARINKEIQDSKVNLSQFISATDEETEIKLDPNIGIPSSDSAVAKISTNENQQFQNEKKAALAEQRNKINAQYPKEPINEDPGVSSSKVNVFGKDEVDEKTDDLMDKLVKLTDIDKILVDKRNDIYINEYCLAHLTYLTKDPVIKENYPFPNTEAEYVLTGSKTPKAAVIGQLYGLRFALDTVAYWAFGSPPGPMDLLWRTVYSVAMGAIQATIDVRTLINGGDIHVVECEFSASNPFNKEPLSEVTLNYADHLRLLFLMEGNSDERLDRIDEIINLRSDTKTANSFTISSGEAEAYIKLWFIPLRGVSMKGPFGTRIEDNKCYISKTVNYVY